MDEMWSFVGKKAQQRWLWHAIDHTSGVILAYVCGVHEDEGLFTVERIFTPIWDLGGFILIMPECIAVTLPQTIMKSENNTRKRSNASISRYGPD